MSEAQTTYPWVNVETVLVDSSLSTSIKIGPGRSDIRARSVTFVVCVAEYSMVCRFSVAPLARRQPPTKPEARTTRQKRDNPFHFLFETDFQNPVSFVDNEGL